MDEFELIEKFFVGPYEDPAVLTGIGDDGAIVRPEAGRDLVAVVDTVVADVHFPGSIEAFDIGYRAAAVNLSDIASMGARPRWMTLALTLKSAEQDWLQRFADGLRAAAAEHGVVLVGGDTASGEQLVVSVQVIGDVDPGAAILRRGARVGDTIYVTGSVGDAAAGLEQLNAGSPDEFLTSRFLRPSPRVAYGQSLAGIASAAIDISDGLYGDLQKLLTASDAGAVINLESLPISAVLQSSFDVSAQRDFALAGGDDYELCFTAAENTLPDPGDLQVSAIGTVTDATGIVCLEDGNVVPYDDTGYLHFL